MIPDALPAYPTVTLVAMVVVVAVDVLVTRSRLVARPIFWVSLAIMFFFQIFVDGWLTRSESTIVNYDDDETLGVRVFYNTPIEDFGFGFALILSTLTMWVWAAERHRSVDAGPVETSTSQTGDERRDVVSEVTP